MAPGTQRFLLWSIAVALTAAGAGAIVFGALAPLAAVDRISPAGRFARPPAIARAAGAVSFADVAQLNLRQPLSDRMLPLAAAADESPATAALPVRLIGTIIEPGRSLAMLQVADGHCVFKAVGQEVAGAVVLAIGDRQATLGWQGASNVLHLPSNDSLPAASAAGGKLADFGHDAAQSSGAQPDAEGGVPIDERQMRALLNRKLILDGN